MPSDRTETLGRAEAFSGQADVADYFALMKPRVMSLVVFTALVGLVRGAVALHPVLAFTALLCIAIGAGAAGALNMWYDADIDAEMTRTRGRPIPAGRVEPGEALAFGAGAGRRLGPDARAHGRTGWRRRCSPSRSSSMSSIYTMWLKRRTPQNIVIGGAAGALPPMIGWAAVTGSRRPRERPAVPHHLHVDAAAFLGAGAAACAATTRAPACRCCRSWPARTRRGGRS